MKIAIVVNSAWAAYNFRKNLAQFLEQAGHKVTFFIPNDGDYSKRLKKEFTCVYYFINAKSLNPVVDFKTFLDLLIGFKKVHPDVVLNFTIKPNIYSTLAAKVYGIPVINNITGLGTVFIKESLITFLVKGLYKFCMSHATLVFFQNSHDLSYFVQNKLIAEKKCKLLPGSGVDTHRFKPSENIYKADKFIFLLIARLLKDKGIYEFIDAIRFIKANYIKQSVEFQLLGEVGVNNQTAIGIEEVNSWVNEDLVNYLGVTDKVEEIIIQCDCIVLPSYREGMPRTILEGFAMAKPAIVTDVPGCKDIVDHGVNGLICKAQSSEDLAEKMILMMDLQEGARVKMGLSGRKKVENLFAEKIVLNSYLNEINKIESYEKDI